MLPDLYSAQAYVDAVGSNYYKYLAAYDINDPVTPFFQLRQLANYLDTNQVLCAVYDSDSSAFDLSFDNSNKLFQIAQGIVRQNNVDYTITAQNLNYAPVFSVYSNSNYYIASIYIDANTLQNNNLINVTTSQPSSLGDNSLAIREKTILAQIKTPCKIQVGSSIYQIGSINLYAGKIYLASSNPVLTANVATNTRIYLIQEPSISCVYTAPFAVSGDAFLSNYLSKTIVPKNAIRLYDVLMQNPSSPALATTGGIDQIKTNFINFYGQTYDADAAQTLSNAIKNFNFNLLQSQSYLDISMAVTNFKAATEQITLSNPSSYWLNTIMLQPEVASIGVDMGRYKKFDFPDAYLEANYNFGDGDLYELLFAFDPTYYSNQNIYSGNDGISNLSVELLEGYGPASNAVPSVIIHGASATINTDYPSGETPVSYQSTSTTSSSANAAFNITFDALNENTYSFYNVYRKTLNNNLSIDLPISTPLEIAGNTNFGTNLPASPTSGSESFVGFSGTSYVLNTNGNLSQYALKFKPRLASGSVSNTVFIGGAALTLSLNAAYTGNATLYAYLVAPNPDLSTYTTLGTSEPMLVQNITTTPVEYSFKFSQYTSGALNLTPLSTYYILMFLTNSDGTNTQVLLSSTTASGSTLGMAYTGSAWIAATGSAYRFRTLGFVDNLSNSGSIINTSLPLSHYVFRGIRQIRNKITRPRNIYAYIPYFKVNSSGESQYTELANDILVNVVGYNSTTGETVQTGYITVPKGTASGNKVLLNDNFPIDTVTYISIEPGTDVTVDSNGQIVWGEYDYLLIIADE
jgi:hypothetical protein